MTKALHNSVVTDKTPKSKLSREPQSPPTLDRSWLPSLPNGYEELEDVEFCFREARHGATYLDRSSTIISEICQAVETLCQDPFRMPRTNERLCQAVRLRLEGLNYDAIGEIFGCTRQNIDSLLKPLKPLLSNEAYRAFFDKISMPQSNDLQVLNMLGTGQSLAQIGTALGVTPETVSNARSRLLSGPLAEDALRALQTGAQKQQAEKVQEQEKKQLSEEMKIAQFLDLRLNQNLGLAQIGKIMVLSISQVRDLMRLAETSESCNPEQKPELHRRRYITPPTPPNPVDPALIAKRQQKVLTLLLSDHNIKEIAVSVNTARSTVWRDLKSLEVSQNEPTRELIRQKREAILNAWRHHRSLRGPE